MGYSSPVSVTDVCSFTPEPSPTAANPSSFAAHSRRSSRNDPQLHGRQCRPCIQPLRRAAHSCQAPTLVDVVADKWGYSDRRRSAPVEQEHGEGGLGGTCAVGSYCTCFWGRRGCYREGERRMAKWRRCRNENVQSRCDA